MLEDASGSLFRQYLTIARLLAGQLDFQSAIRAVAKEIALIIPHDHMDVCIITPGSTFHTLTKAGWKPTGANARRHSLSTAPSADCWLAIRIIISPRMRWRIRASTSRARFPTRSANTI